MISSILLSFDWHQILNPQFYIDNGGLWLLVFIIFAETGLMVGFFLPGDSLLFVAGIFANKLAASVYDTAHTSDFFNLLFVIVLCTIAGILGNVVGYWFGKKIGPTMFQWRDRFIFKHKYLVQAKEFYDKHGGGAIVFARFLPLIRTFAPIVAGIVGMERQKFMFYNIIGCIAWVSSMLAAGHYLYKFFIDKYQFDLTAHLELIVLCIVLITTAPVLIKLFTKPKNKAA